MSIQTYFDKAKEAASHVGNAIKESATTAGQAVLNGAKATVTAVHSGLTNRSAQDELLTTASDKIDNLAQAGLDTVRGALETAETTLKTDGYNTLNRIVDVSPLVEALRNAKLEISEEDSTITSVMKKGVNALLSYHEKTAIAGEKATRFAFKSIYILTKYILFPLNFFRAGRVAQEAIALGVAALARAITTVAALIIFALPELVMLGGLVAGGTFAGLGIAAGGATAASILTGFKVSGYVLAGLVGLGYIVRNEVMHAQAKERHEQTLALLNELKGERLAAASHDTQVEFEEVSGSDEESSSEEVSGSDEESSSEEVSGSDDESSIAVVSSSNDQPSIAVVPDSDDESSAEEDSTPQAATGFFGNIRNIVGY